MRALRRRARGARLGPPTSAAAALRHRHRGPRGPVTPLRGPRKFPQRRGPRGQGPRRPRAAATPTAEPGATGPSRLPRSRSAESRSRVPGAPRPAGAAPGRTGAVRRRQTTQSLLVTWLQPSRERRAAGLHQVQTLTPSLHEQQSSCPA
ncbi:translation initiation factor IF-2-like isoform X2 [Onychomys torridus]|uniref:translation initiation factor IF-2-like isoform X2 n=1 Tax=Onychomys torridus TaxID=38674 RepID=UPI00167FB494|nr:translation initiation factor IF-2-like isoform X2 [Onychomys torridus]